MGHLDPSLEQELRTQTVSVTVPGLRNFPGLQSSESSSSWEVFPGSLITFCGVHSNCDASDSDLNAKCSKEYH